MSKRIYDDEKVIECYCDCCGDMTEYRYYGKLNLGDCQGQLKECGWIARKIGDDWYDFCSTKCYEDSI